MKILLNGIPSDLNALIHDQEYEVKDNHGKWVKGKWESVGEHCQFLCYPFGFLHHFDLTEVRDL